MSGALAGASAMTSFLTAIMQYEQSEKARRMSVEERRKLENLIRATQNPAFDFNQIDPEDFKVVQKYQPQVAAFVEEQAPQLTRMDSADAKLARDSQREALNRLRSMSQGNDPLADAEMTEALNRADVSNRGRTMAVREDFARRGQGGGTAEMLAQLLGTQQSNEMAADNSRAAFIEAQKRRLQALRDAGSMAGQIGDDEYRLERGNNDLINSYNQRFAARKQGWADGAADAYNDAQRFNITNAQDVANRNVQTGNQFRVNERAREDDLKQRSFDNEMGKVKTLAGVTDMARADAMSQARDRNSAISGANDGIQSGISYASSSPQRQQAPWQAPAQQQQVMAGEDYGDALNRRYRTGRANA